jgi:hypothetical protein
VEEVKRTALAALVFVFIISIQSFCSVIHVPTAHNLQFPFGKIPEGTYRLAVTWQDENGNVQQPFHTSYPIKVVGTNAAAVSVSPSLGRHASGI